MKKLIYADNAATTKLDIAAFEAMKPYLLDEYGNASQPYSFARKSKQAIQDARKIIAECIGAMPEEIFFTSGGTESDNWAIKGVVYNSSPKKAVITSEIEHHAVLRACADIEKQGYPVAYLPVTDSGVITIEALQSVITRNTALVSIMLANNEIGTIQSIQELCEVAHKYGALFHTDAVQAVGHISIDVKELGVDMLSASAHKFNGPKGVGFLYIKKGTPIASIISGGAQEFEMRAGTENVAAIVGMAAALKNNVDRIREVTKHLQQLEQALLDALDNAKIDYVRNGENHLPGNLSLSFKGANGEALLHRLDLMGIIVSTGSACDSVNNQVSHVLRAISLDDEYAEGTIRISLSNSNRSEDIQRIASAISKILVK
jgi:cysteine desulfurase